MENFGRLILLLPVSFTPTFATKKASCNGWTLTAPNEGDFICNPAGAVISTHGTRCTLTCDTGYSAQHEVLVCSEKGGWVPTNSPECQVDSTMTLVIVLSIVASIMAILGLSVLYAKTSTKCRGKRRRLDDEDPEAANKRTHDTSTYYDQVKKLQRKRRLHAKRQSRSIDSKRKKKAGSAKDAKKMSNGNKLKRDKKRSSRGVPDKKRSTHQARSSSRKHNVQKPTKDRKEGNRHRVAETPRNGENDFGKKLKRKDDFKNNRKRNISRNSSFHRRKNAWLQNFRTILFCIPFRERRRERFKHKRRGAFTTDHSVGKARKRGKPTAAATATSPVSSALSSSVSSTNKCTPIKPTQAAAKISTTLKKPPRPPPPKFSTLTSRIRERSSNDSENDENHKAVVSSGYSSEGGKHKRQVTKSEAEEHDDEAQTMSSNPPNKRIEMMSYDMKTGEKDDSNPYDHYPVAQSYRQYLDFENDYRRTTGDYHPQYGNIKVIPIQTAKKKKKLENNAIATDKDPQEKQSTQGGMKYIDIASKESDDNDVHTKKHSKKNHKERYENPSARDRRTHLEDRSRKEMIKRSKDHKKADHKKADRKTKKLNETKRAIADEKIIVNGTTANDAVHTTHPKVQKASAIEQKKAAAKNAEKAKK